jgi:hypothetical protein
VRAPSTHKELPCKMELAANNSPNPLVCRILRLYFFLDSLEIMPSKWTRDYLNSTKTQATKKEAPTIAESTREHPQSYLQWPPHH